MATDVSERFDWIANLGAPGGVLDVAIEHLQYEQFQAVGDIRRSSSPLDNAKRLKDIAEDASSILGLIVFEDAIDADQLVELLESMPSGCQLMAFLRHYVDPRHPRIVTRLVAANTDDEFTLKVTGHLHRLVTNQTIGSKFNPETPDFPEDVDKFDSLADYIPSVDRRAVVRIKDGGVNFEFFSELRSDSRHLVVFGQDALNRAVVGLPHFYRWTWAPEINASVIFLNDPSIYAADNLLAGWWVGTRERDYVEDAVSLIRRIMDLTGIEAEDVTFFGASAGGFSSLQMAAVLHGSRAIVDIPQVNLETYFARSASDASIKAGLGFAKAEDVEDEFRHRIDVVERFMREEYVPDFLYLQNNRDTQHVSEQMGQFLDRVGTLMRDHEWAHAQFTVETYSAWHLKKGGHFPLSRSDTIQRINRYIETPRQRPRSKPIRSS